MSKSNRPSLLRGPRRSRWDQLKVWGPGLLLVAIGFFIASFFVKPAPPKQIVIATGSKSGSYFEFAAAYGDHLGNQGIEVVVRETAGSIENYRLLMDESSGVSVAIVQGGTAPGAVVGGGGASEGGEITAIASVYLEPVWVFHRGREPFTRMEQLKGRIIAVGGEGSGVRALAMQLLEETGVTATAAPDAATGTATRFEPLGGQNAVDALKRGEIDAAIFVISPQAALVRDLIDEPDIHLMSLDLAPAYARRLPFLSSVTLPEGVLDLKANLPGRDVRMVAAAANIVARGDVHPAVVPLLIEAAEKAHQRGGLISDPGMFPSQRLTEFPMNRAAEYYFENGKSFLYRVLPFWAASMADRMKILLLPLLTLLIPLFRLAPPLYRWRTRSRIYRWYRVLRVVDEHIGDPSKSATLGEEAERLRQLDEEVNSTVVPLSYMEEYYNLRVHIELMRYRLKEAMKTGE